MRIGLNGTPFDALSSGARERFLRLYGEAARRSQRHRFVLYSPRGADLRAIFAGPLEGSAQAPFSPGRPLRRFLRSGRWFERRLAADGVDLFVTDHFPVLPSTLLTIHDLRFLALPDAGTAARRAYFRWRYAKVAARAQIVVTVSETIRGEIVERLGLREAAIHVVPNGVGEEFRRCSDEEVEELRRRAGLPGEYLLSVGVLERRKNLPLLVRAYADAGGRALPPLVLSGRGGEEEVPLRRLVAELGLTDRVIFGGYVPEADLPALYSGALALLMPSRYEGFGLPVIQAFACGTPVVCSRAGALTEIAGDAARLVAPDDFDGWTDAVREVLGDPAVASRLAEAGLERARAYTWEAAADRFLDLLGNVTPRLVRR